MPYQNVGTPRFYINVIEWLNITAGLEISVGGNDGDNKNVHRTLPVERHSYDPVVFQDLPLPFTDKTFVAILGHDSTNYGDNTFRLFSTYTPIYPTYIDDINFTNPIKDGYSIATFNYNGESALTVSPFAGNIPIGSVIIGTYFDMPHSPDLSLTMTRDMDGVKRVRTKGGHDLVDYKYTRPATWREERPAWGLNSNYAHLSHSGRRTWSLSFSYLQESDIFPTHNSLNNYGTSDWTGSSSTANTILDGSGSNAGFYNSVIHRTNGQLPFLFQPDSNDFTNMAICKFDMNNFSFQQQSPGHYSVQLKLKEVW